MKFNHLLVLTIFSLVICLPLNAQNPLSALDTITDNQGKLDYMENIINQQWRSNPTGMKQYAKLFDSLANLVPSEENKAKALNVNGMAYYVNEEYDQAIDYFLDAARILETIETDIKIYQIYSNVASCYNIRNDFDNTETYFQRALDIAQSKTDSVWIANIQNNLAVLYMQNERYDQSNSMIEKALDYYTSKGDTLMMGITYMNAGNLKTFSQDYPEAITTYLRSMEFIQPQQFPLVHAVANTGIGIALREQQQYEAALPYLKKGLQTAKDIGHTEQIMESYNALSTYYATTGQYEDAYQLSQESQKLKDSLLTSEQDANLARALAQFETEKKEAQLKLVTLEADKAKEQRKALLYLVLGVLLIAGLIGFFLQKNKRKNRLLAKQKSLLEATVNEKNILLQETHHRVKNSFQMVSSLLYIQSETAQENEAKLAIREAQNRVRSMVLIHQKLYNKEQLIGIDSKEYIEDFTKDVLESHQFEGTPLAYQVEAESMILDVETITPMGLILNELITNVLKHAFDHITTESHMIIFFEKSGDQLLLQVLDNGVGLSDQKREGSFGLELVQALSQKLKADFHVTTQPSGGTKAELIMNRFQIL